MVGATVRGMFMRRAIAAVAVVLVVGAGCADDRDLLAESACRHFNNVLVDIRDSMLEPQQVRVKFREVNADARHADDLKVRSGAQGLVDVAATPGLDGLSGAVASMRAACKPH